MTDETSRERQAVPDLQLARLPWNPVCMVALGIGIFQVQSRRNGAVMDRERRDRGIQRACRADEMTRRGLDAAGGEPVGGVAEDGLDRLRLRQIAEARAGPVGGNVVDGLRLELGLAERALDRDRQPSALRIRL